MGNLAMVLLRCAVILLIITKTAFAEDRWVQQTMEATKACAEQFKQRFGDSKLRSAFADCLTDQTDQAIKACIGTSRAEFADCVSGRALSVMRACDLSQCR
jgi:hypothetical protein